MANEEQLELIKQGTNAWNKWREEHANTRPDLIEANLGAGNLSGANLFGAYLFDTDLTGVNLGGANLSAANLSAANLFRADLVDTDLSGANLSDANLTYVRLVHTNLENANLSECRIYGISAWNLRGVPTNQLDLIITNYHEPIVTIDNLEVAQFIYLLLNNQKNPPSNRHYHLESRPNPWSLCGGTEVCA